jgi:hypothetical protein
MPDLDTAGATVPLATQVRGRTVFGVAVGGILTPLHVTPAGDVVVSGGAVPVTSLGPTPPPTVIPALATVALPVAPPVAQFMIVQNRGPAGTLVLVRELGGVPGAGIILQRFGAIVLDGSYPLEIQNTIAAASSVQITWEV